jgi:hypothetical protein
MRILVFLKILDNFDYLRHTPQLMPVAESPIACGAGGSDFSAIGGAGVAGCQATGLKTPNKRAG